MLVCSWRTDKWLLLVSHYCVVVVVCLMCAAGGCGWVFMLFVVVYCDVEDRVVNVCVYVIKL
jgi:hypothetical protein